MDAMDVGGTAAFDFRYERRASASSVARIIANKVDNIFVASNIGAVSLFQAEYAKERPWKVIRVEVDVVN